MGITERQSRRERSQWRLGRVLKIFFILIVILAAGMAWWIIREPEMEQPPAQAQRVLPPMELHDLCDSLILAAYRSFGLTDTIGPGQLTKDGGEVYRKYSQGWPDSMPPMVFAFKLTAMARAESLGCDCIEARNGKWLDCSLVRDGSIGSRIRVEQSSDVIFADREFVLAFDNFGTLSAPQIRNLLNSGAQFSYMADLRISPVGLVSQIIKGRGITAILGLPASTEGWRKLAEDAGLAGTVSSVPPKSMIDEALSRHPATKLIYFDFSEGANWEIVSAVAEAAKSKKIAYLLTPDQDQTVVNYVGQAGLKIFTGHFDEKLSGKRFPAINGEIIKSVLAGGPGKGAIVRADVTELTTPVLWSSKIRFDRMGIKIRPLMQVVQPFEQPPVAGL